MFAFDRISDIIELFEVSQPLPGHDVVDTIGGHN